MPGTAPLPPAKRRTRFAARLVARREDARGAKMLGESVMTVSVLRRYSMIVPPYFSLSLDPAVLQRK